MYLQFRLFPAWKREFNERESARRRRTKCSTRVVAFSAAEIFVFLCYRSIRKKCSVEKIYVGKYRKREWKSLFTLERRQHGAKTLVFVSRGYPRWRWHHEFTPTVERAIKRVAVSFNATGVTPLEKNVVPIGHANVLASRPVIHGFTGIHAWINWFNKLKKIDPFFFFFFCFSSLVTSLNYFLREK